MRSFIDSGKLAADLDAMAVKLSVFSISPEAASMAAQRLRDLQAEVTLLEKQRDDAINSTASRYFTPPPAPRRRIISGVEVERINESAMYRVRFGESVLDFMSHDWSSATLYSSLVQSFSQQLAATLGVITMSDTPSPGMAQDSLSRAALTMPRPSTVEVQQEDEPEDEGPVVESEYVNGEWVCSCPSCTRSREVDADLIERIPQEVASALGSLDSTVRGMAMAALRQQYREPESERAISASDENHWRSISPEDR